MKKKRKIVSVLLLTIFAGLGYLAFDVLFLHPPACEIDPKDLSYYDPNVPAFPYSSKPAFPSILPVINLTYHWPFNVGYDLFFELERNVINWDSRFCVGKVALRTYFTDTWRADVCPICSSIRLLGPSVQLFVR